MFSCCQGLLLSIRAIGVSQQLPNSNPLPLQMQMFEFNLPFRRTHKPSRSAQQRCRWRLRTSHVAARCPSASTEGDRLVPACMLQHTEKGRASQGMAEPGGVFVGDLFHSARIPWR